MKKLMMIVLLLSPAVTEANVQRIACSFDVNGSGRELVAERSEAQGERVLTVRGDAFTPSDTGQWIRDSQKGRVYLENWKDDKGNTAQLYSNSNDQLDSGLVVYHKDGSESLYSYLCSFVD
ncbi:hypothetical protein [Citrobacter sp. R-1.5.2]|uniref:hypothetical protein n=1 Tax=Citrobacter sp. R-1.5.2 TaxID=3046183 RepID=UPI002B2481EC|nr:hypothetical protein [Citrobacter sp. R-1.5.2]MEB2418828.1 hypothetical protein [Citrobacter sp. R-1.5.2]